MAGVWQVDRRVSTREKQAQLRLIHMEYHIERARRILQDMEQRALKTLENIEKAELRFASLQDSFTLLQQEHKNWKEQKDLE